MLPLCRPSSQVSQLPSPVIAMQTDIHPASITQPLAIVSCCSVFVVAFFGCSGCYYFFAPDHDSAALHLVIALYILQQQGVPSMATFVSILYLVEQHSPQAGCTHAYCPLLVMHCS